MPVQQAQCYMASGADNKTKGATVATNGQEAATADSMENLIASGWRLELALEVKGRRVRELEQELADEKARRAALEADVSKLRGDRVVAKAADVVKPDGLAWGRWPGDLLHVRQLRHAYAVIYPAGTVAADRLERRFEALNRGAPAAALEAWALELEQTVITIARAYEVKANATTALEDKLEAREKRVLELERIERDARAMVARSESTAADAVAVAHRAEARVAELEAKRGEAEAFAAELEATLAQEADRLADARREVAALETTAAHVNGLEEKLADCELELKRTRAARDLAIANTRRADSHVAALEAKLAECERQIPELEAKLSERSEAARIQTEHVARAHELEAASRARAHELEARIRELELEATKANDGRIVAERRAAKLEEVRRDAVADARLDASQLEAERASEVAAVKRAEARTAELEASTAELVARLSKLEDMATSANARQRMADRRADNLAARGRMLEASLAALAAVSRAPDGSDLVVHVRGLADLAALVAAARATGATL